eukprot:s2271_g3.t2
MCATFPCGLSKSACCTSSARFLAAKPFALTGQFPLTLALDGQGFGQSDGARGYFESFQEIVDDFVGFVKAKWAEVSTHQGRPPGRALHRCAPLGGPCSAHAAILSLSARAKVWPLACAAIAAPTMGPGAAAELGRSRSLARRSVRSVSNPRRLRPHLASAQRYRCPNRPLPSLTCRRVRNLSEELRAAKEDPELKAARKAQEEAVARDYEAKRKWEESTKFLAIGGQATMDVAAKTAALQRSQAELQKAQDAVAQAEAASTGDEGCSAQPSEESGEGRTIGEDESAKPDANLVAARRVLQLAERRVVQDRCAVERAQELRNLDEHRKAVQQEREKHEEDLRVALQKVKSLNGEIQR